jgi:ubiquinone/menaquinone biosynthesis C-methylase UbiE
VTLLQDQGLAAAFDRASGAYDRLVSVNPGYHHHLRRSARRLLGARGDACGPRPRVLDLGCGTGASTAALLHVAPDARVTAVDASAGMLARARAKHWRGEVTFVHSPAEHLAAAGVHGPYDAVLAAYLVRNLTAPDAVLGDLLRLLRPGGRLAVHDYALSGAAVHRAVWNAVCGALIVPLGSLGPGGAPLYRHLRRSVLEFGTAAAFARRLAAAGFAEVTAGTVPGWQRGIVHTFVARRPQGSRPAG